MTRYLGHLVVLEQGDRYAMDNNSHLVVLPKDTDPTSHNKAFVSVMTDVEPKPDQNLLMQKYRRLITPGDISWTVL